MSSPKMIAPLHIGKFIPPPYAGVEAHVDSLLRALRHDVRSTLLAGALPGNVRSLVAEGASPYRLLEAPTYGQFASAFVSPSIPWLARRELLSGYCNLLHVHVPNPWGDLAVLASPRDVPVVMTWHSDIVRQRRLYVIYQHIQRLALARTDRIIVFTPKHYESSAQLHQLELSSRIAYVPTGLDFTMLGVEQADEAMSSRLSRFANGRPMLLSVGRHVYYKGYEYLLAAMAKMRSDAVLAMVGAGVLSDSLRRQAKTLGIEERILFLGEINPRQLVAAFHSCDIFCQPSIEPSEAFGIASAEAMACGKPTVVCQLHNGVNYLNREGETSLVVPPKDVAALADALDVLAADESLRGKMGRAASTWVRKEFSMEAMRQGTLAVYRSLL